MFSLYRFDWFCDTITLEFSAGFLYRLGRLKPRASTSRGPLAKKYKIVVIVNVIDLSYTCCHKPSVIFLALHFRIIRLISRHWH